MEKWFDKYVNLEGHVHAFRTSVQFFLFGNSYCSIC